MSILNSKQELNIWTKNWTMYVIDFVQFERISMAIKNRKLTKANSTGFLADWHCGILSQLICVHIPTQQLLLWSLIHVIDFIQEVKQPVDAWMSFRVSGEVKISGFCVRHKPGLSELVPRLWICTVIDPSGPVCPLMNCYGHQWVEGQKCCIHLGSFNGQTHIAYFSWYVSIIKGSIWSKAYVYTSLTGQDLEYQHLRLFLRARCVKRPEFCTD